VRGKLIGGGLLAATTLAAGCGGDGATKTVTVASPPATQTAPATPPAGTAPPAATQPPAATTPQALPPLPGGRAALDGSYRMRVRRTDYVRENIVAGILQGQQSTWPMKSVCAGGDCKVKVRRELQSGAYENFTLSEVKPGSYADRSTGTIKCLSLSERDPQPSRQRLSLRVSGVAEINGRPTAQRVDAYLTIETKCDGLPTRGIISWRGSRLP